MQLYSYHSMTNYTEKRLEVSLFSSLVESPEFDFGTDNELNLTDQCSLRQCQ